MKSRKPSARRGFTLLELLVAMGVILILISILVPTISMMRRKANTAATAAEITAIAAAIEAYHQAFSRYPGPLDDTRQIGAKVTVAGTPAQDDPDIIQIQPPQPAQQVAYVTGSENLVLGLLGGLRNVAGAIQFDAALIGRGPASLNLSNPKRHEAFLEANIPLTQRPGAKAGDLNFGKYKDNSGEAFDSNIPEILDRMPDPMPILYMRARRGANGVVSDAGQDASAGPLPPVQYDINQILGYTSNIFGNGYIGEGKSIRMADYVGGTTPSQGKLPHGLATVNQIKTLEKNGGANYQYPYDAFPYFVNRAIPPTNVVNPNASGTAKKKDSYILISAGPDRVYGTPDDITNFGGVND